MYALIASLLLVGCPETDTGGKTTETGDSQTERYHPDGWSAADVHGLAANLQEQDCLSCHGDDLTGGTSGYSCDSCHPSDWREDCTFCHGGTDNVSGAPPVDIDGEAVAISFPEHTVHVDSPDHASWTCDQCHQQPTDVLSAGHFLVDDPTAGVAEVGFDAGLAAGGSYSTGSCSNLYCHGDGQSTGSVSTGASLACDGCHGDATDLRTLSGAHPGHLGAGATCGDCHGGTATGNDTIADGTLHVDGLVEVSLASGMTYTDGTCTGTCHDVDHDGSSWTEGYHPEGWDAPEVHGLAAKLQEDDCTVCHGADLTGDGSADSCDSCHAADWRTNCTYCHGGDDNLTGAPPVDIDGGSDLSFPEHSAHVEETIHAAWGCEQCHAVPDDVLSDGHVFVGDDSPGVAEVDLDAGLSAGATYSAGTCADGYCHGDGRDPGTISSGTTVDCGSCHGTVSSPGTLSSVHPEHLASGAGCADCHATTVSDDETVSDPTLHVDGLAETSFPSGMTYSGDTCTGTCHDVAHDGATWSSGAFHPTGWSDADAHGLAAKLQTMVCTDCHGEDLEGGISGESCDSCHEATWRTDCTYCHGGEEDSTGAPPADIDGGADLSFPEHPAHVSGAEHPAWDCDTCHQKPEDVLSDGHVFLSDTTPGVAEVDLGGGLSAGATYSAGTCADGYCHGDGQVSGTVSSGATLGCDGCHGSTSAPGTLSAVHPSHLADGATCDDCHADTVSGDTIVGAELHVDGAVETAFPSGMSWDGSTCTGTCHDVVHDGSGWVEGSFHPAGWDEADAHGPAAKLLEDDCTTCHGADLSGGTSGASCDSCHEAGWRTDCTYCHGGDENTTGAPPSDIDGGPALSFPEHSAHVEERSHAAWDCDTCHQKPEDVLSDGHLFLGDTTPAEAEVDLSGGLSATGTYADGSCANTYCHGDGQSTGSVHSGDTVDCASCHGSATAPGTLSTVHEEHLGKGATCDECHADTVSGDIIVTPALHVDGAVQTAFPSGMSWDGTTCTGTCHDVVHGGSRWTDGAFHPEGWDAPDQHGLAADLQEQDCTTCHGADLSGGTSSKSCDECHASGWRSNCTYCHGGIDDTTGAPPEDIDGSTSGLSFPEHGVHVQAVDHAAWDCAQCHVTPTDALSSGHVFVDDTTPAVAEVALGAGLSPDGAWASGTCSNLYCHGDGQDNGSVVSGATLDCDGCHGSADLPGTLSAVHPAHLDKGATCGECHAGTATDSDTISGPSLHVDGVVETSFPSGMSYTGDTCEGTCHGVLHAGASWTGGTFHGTGWDDPDEHGLAANLGEQPCINCHGDDLAGGTSGESCDSCHTSGWRTDCTYCHGGVDNTTGAPPTDIDGSTTGLSFDEHSEHVAGTDHVQFDCDTCHQKPTDVLSSGHVFLDDTTPAVAELDFSGGLSSAGSYAGSGSCSNLYCHGNGNGTLGSVTTGATLSCTGCHGGSGATTGMSGDHGAHLGHDVRATCNECHAATASSSTVISDGTKHVDGTAETQFPSGVVYSSGRCTGTCHGESHSSRRW